MNDAATRPPGRWQECVHDRQGSERINLELVSNGVERQNLERPWREDACIVDRSRPPCGGFGRRLETDSVEQAVALAKQVTYPLKVVWTREEDIRHDIVRPMYHDRISAVVDAEGQPFGLGIAHTQTPGFCRP